VLKVSVIKWKCHCAIQPYHVSIYRLLVISQLTIEVSSYVSHKGAYCYHRVAQAGFRAIEGVAPVVDFIDGLDIDARSVGGREGQH
jgi:hypothetical protein